jgi:hypothetical protein
MSQPLRRHAARVTAATAAVSVLALSGCTPGATGTDPDSYYVAVCADPRTGIRVPDYLCAQAPQDYDTADAAAYRYSVRRYPHLWYYERPARVASLPAVGSRVVGGSYTTPRLTRTGVGGRSVEVPRISRSGSVPPTGGQLRQAGVTATTSSTSSSRTTTTTATTTSSSATTTSSARSGSRRGL